MALEGNINSFGLAEILQLIAVQQKTGMLTVVSSDKSIVMFFRDGQIISTRDRRRRARDPFKEYLTRYGVLGRDELLRISQIASQSKLDLVDILSSEGFLSEEQLHHQWRMQIQESMHEMLTWEECTYKFISSTEIIAGIRTLEQYNIEAMLMESMRRIDEFPQMATMFPRDDVLITRVSAGEPDQSNEGMTTNEKQIHELLSDIISLRDLIARGKMPVFDVYESLKLLKGRNLIKVKDEQPGGSSPSTSRRRDGSKRRKRIGNVFPVVIATILFAGASVFGFRHAVSTALTGELPVIRVARDDAVERTRVEKRLRWILEAFRARNGYYPGKLEDLHTEGMAGPAILEAARSFEIRYRLTQSRKAYILL